MASVVDTRDMLWASQSHALVVIYAVGNDHQTFLLDRMVFLHAWE